MFGLSPLSGRLTDRFGSVPVILAGLAVIAASSVLAAAAPPEGGVWLFLALFLLGYGWNLGTSRDRRSSRPACRSASGPGSRA